jgi:uncharacterized cupredoxin-like copper-binding protein
MTSSRARAALVLISALGLLAAACGDDDDAATAPEETAAASDTTETTASPETTTGGGGDFCEAGPAVDQVLAADEPDPAALEEALAAAEAAAPAEIADAVGSAAGAVRTAFETGDFAVLETDEVADALAQINGYYVSDCGFNALNVTAVNYAYQGMEETVPAGSTVLTLTNEGTELHEAIVLRINDDVTESAEEILALPEDEARTKVTEAGAAFAFPGETGSGTVAFEPGRYLMVCFIPVGLTPEVLAEVEASGTEPEGAPHFTEGMLAEFTVE